jgi:hypothetical protein
LAEALEDGHCGLLAHLHPAAALLRQQHAAIVELREASHRQAVAIERLKQELRMLVKASEEGDIPRNSVLWDFARATLTNTEGLSK